jgi:hypothetical protein
MLQGQLRIQDVDCVTAEKVDDCERTVSDKDKLFVLLHEFSGFRDDLFSAVLEVVLADASRRTQVLSVVQAVCLNAWEPISIDSQTPAVTNEDGKSADVVHRPDATCLGVHLDHRWGSIYYHDKQHMCRQGHYETPDVVCISKIITRETLDRININHYQQIEKFSNHVTEGGSRDV